MRTENYQQGRRSDKDEVFREREKSVREMKTTKKVEIEQDNARIHDEHSFTLFYFFCTCNKLKQVLSLPISFFCFIIYSSLSSSFKLSISSNLFTKKKQINQKSANVQLVDKMCIRFLRTIFLISRRLSSLFLFFSFFECTQIFRLC